MFGIRSRLERRRLSALWDYSLLFALLAFVVWAIFYYFDKSYVWTPDGEDIYFVVMTYTRNYIYGILRTLFHTGKLVLPAWDFAIGQGNNVLVGAHFSPFFLLALVTPARFLEYTYGLMTLLQIYCSGAAVVVLMRRLGETEPFPVTMGALVYAFCGFVFNAGFSHIYFISNMLLLLPLILASAERYLQERKWGCFVAVIAVTLASGYYYAFMDTLLMTVYLVIRQLCVNGRDLKRSFFELMRLFLFYLWGFALSLVIFLPGVMNYFICGRTDTGGDGVSLFYGPGTYREMLASFVSPQMSGNWNQTSFAGIALIALAVIYLRRDRETRVVRWSFPVLTAFYCLPIAGSVFNGFGYVTNRWCFGYALCVAVATVYGVKELWDLDAKQKRTVLIVAGVWAVAALALDFQRNVVVGVVLLALALLAAFRKDRSPDHERGRRRIAAVTALALTVHMMIYFLPVFQNGISRYKGGGTVVSGLQKTPEFAAKKLEDDSFYRIETPPTRTNRFALSGENGVSSYWSALPAKMTDFYQAFELASVRQSYAVWGLDNCASLEALSSVKYYLNQEDTGLYAPYGFVADGTVKARSRTYTVYRNQYALPLGYTYDSWMSEEDFRALNPVQRQQAMLQCAVMDQGPAGLAQRQPEMTVKNQEVRVSKLNGVSQKDERTFQVGGNGGSVTLSFDPVQDSETYLYLEGFSSSSRCDISVTAGDITRKTSVYKDGTLHWFHRQGIVFHLGYSEQGRDSCTIQFPTGGKFTFRARVIALPMQDYVTHVTERGQQVLEDIQVKANTVTGSIQLTQPRLLVLSIPHIGGWRATVDGVPAELLEVNELYMGLMLDAGRHQIRLTYHMPGLKEGAAVSAAAFLALGGYALAAGQLRRRNRKQKTGRSE